MTNRYRQEDHEALQAALVEAMWVAAEKVCKNHVSKNLEAVLYVKSRHSFRAMLDELVGDALFTYGIENINARTATMEEVYSGAAS